MKTKHKGNVTDTGKTVIIAVLYAVSIAIILSGAAFAAYSIIGHVSLNVLNTKVHGAAFGAVIAFLGVRYFLSLKKLKDEVYKSSGFSWSNFRKGGMQKEAIKSK